MSIAAMTWAWGLEELPPSETLVLLALADQANDQGLCWPSQETIASKARCSLRSVKRAVNSLRNAGLLEVEHRGREGFSKGRKSNIYRLNVGAEISAKSELRANLALSEDAPVDNFDEIGTFPCDSNKGPDWHINPDSADLGATGGPLIGGTRFKEPKLKTIPNHLSPVKAASGGLDGVDGMDEDWALLRDCLPVAMLEVLPGSGAEVVSGILRNAVSEGWRPVEIQRRLAANPLPSLTSNAPGLVIYRLRDVLKAPVPGAKPAVPEKTRRRNEACLAHVDQILQGISSLSLQEQENLLTSASSGFFGRKDDRDFIRRVEAKTSEVVREKFRLWEESQDGSAAVI